MTTVGMYYDVIPEKASIFVERFREVIKLLDTMPGHGMTRLYVGVDDPYSYAVLSEWDSPDAFYDFIKSDVFRQTTAWGREQVLRGAPRHKIYPRSDDLARPSAAPTS